MRQQFAEIFKRFGPWAAAHAIVYRVAKKLMILDVTYLMVLDGRRSDAKPTGDDGQITFRFLGAKDVEQLASEPGNELSRELAQRLESGRDFCLAAFDAERLASYCWLALDSIEPQHNRGARIETGVGLSFPSNAAFVYKGFTHPKFRGRRIYPQLMQRAASSMSEKGVRYIISTADWTNHAALLGCKRSGKVRVGTIWRFGWRFWMKTLARRVELDDLSVRIGTSAQIIARPTKDRRQREMLAR